MKLLENLMEISRADVDWGSAKPRNTQYYVVLEMKTYPRHHIIVHGVFAGKATANLVANSNSGEVVPVTLNKPGKYKVFD